jgi:O-methyltransferase domain
VTQDNRDHQFSPPTPPPQALLEMVFGMWMPRAVQIAAELGLADLLVDGPREINELAVATETHAPSLYRLLRALASANVFAETEPGLFAQSDYSTYLVSSHPTSLRDVARMNGAEWQWRSYAALAHSIKTGEPAFNQVYGVDLWQYFDKIDPAAGRAFDAAMTNVSARSNESVARTYDFSSFRTLVDVGGGRGSTLAAVLAAHPGLHGILFDRPSVVSGAKEILQAAGVADRCQVTPGDFMTDPVPAGADAYMLKGAINGWNDEDACAVLRNCRHAMPGPGRVLVVEPVLPPPPVKVPWYAAGLDMQLLKDSPGHARTEQQFQTLFEAAGFTLTRILSTASPFSIVEGTAAEAERSR